MLYLTLCGPSSCWESYSPSVHFLLDNDQSLCRVSSVKTLGLFLFHEKRCRLCSLSPLRVSFTRTLFHHKRALSAFPYKVVYQFYRRCRPTHYRGSCILHRRIGLPIRRSRLRFVWQKWFVVFSTEKLEPVPDMQYSQNLWSLRIEQFSWNLDIRNYTYFFVCRTKAPEAQNRDFRIQTSRSVQVNSAHRADLKYPNIIFNITVLIMSIIT